jgi:hypothetical protein
MPLSRIDLEIPYSSSLEAAFKFILQDPILSSVPESSSFQFIRTARYLRKNAPQLFQIREMGAKYENRMDRWLWDLLEEGHPPEDLIGKSANQVAGNKR